MSHRSQASAGNAVVVEDVGSGDCQVVFVARDHITGFHANDISGSLPEVLGRASESSGWDVVVRYDLEMNGFRVLKHGSLGLGEALGSCVDLLLCVFLGGRNTGSSGFHHGQSIGKGFHGWKVAAITEERNSDIVEVGSSPDLVEFGRHDDFVVFVSGVEPGANYERNDFFSWLR